MTQIVEKIKGLIKQITNMKYQGVMDDCIGSMWKLDEAQ